jgi:hypothetical protein
MCYKASHMRLNKIVLKHSPKMSRKVLQKNERQRKQPWCWCSGSMCARVLSHLSDLVPTCVSVCEKLIWCLAWKAKDAQLVFSHGPQVCLHFVHEPLELTKPVSAHV